MWPAAQLPVHEERRISAEQPQPTAAHRTITTARRPDHIRLSALVRSRSTQFIVHASSQLGHGPPKRGHCSAILAGCCLQEREKVCIPAEKRRCNRVCPHLDCGKQKRVRKAWTGIIGFQSVMLEWGCICACACRCACIEVGLVACM